MAEESSISPYRSQKEHEEKTDQEKLGTNQESRKKEGGKDRIKKYLNIHSPQFNWITFILIAILISASLVTMFHTLNLPFYDLEAERTVEKQARDSITHQALQEASIPASKRAAIVEKKYQEIKKSQEYKDWVEETAQEYKEDYRDETGQNYLYGADSYFYYRLTKGIIEENQKVSQGLPNVYAASFKAMKIFNSKATIKGSIFYLPVLFGILSVILFFFIVKRFTNEIAAFLASLFLAVNPSFFMNTRAGFIDTNSLNILLSIIIIYLFLHTIELKKTSIFTAIMIIPALWLFKSIWSGWYYIVAVMTAYIIAFLILYTGSKITLLKSKRYIPALLILLAAATGIIYQFATSKYMAHILSRFRFAEGFFPSGMIGVGELQGATLERICSGLGGYAIVIFVLCSIALMIWKIIKELKAASEKELSIRAIAKNFSFRLFVIVYFFILLVPQFFAQRFKIYFAPAFCMALGIGIYYAMPTLMRLTKHIGLNIKKKYLKTALAIILSILLILSIQGELRLNMMTRPLMNDAIYNTALEIKNNSSEDAKINLWWDYGYLYQAIAERHVAFHGGSFESPRLHWMAKALFTDDENLSAGIIRMLDCNGESKAFNAIAGKTGKAEAIDTMHKILPMAKEEAEAYLSANSLPKKVIDYTHCKPRESFFVVGEKLAKKISIIKYYADFDFKKNYDKLSIKGMDSETAIEHLMDKYSITRKEARAYNIELSGFDPNEIPSISSISKAEPCREKNGKIMCLKNFVIDLSSDDISYKNMHPPSFTFYDGSSIMRKEYDDAELKYAMVLIKKKDDYSIYFVDNEFAKSMLFNMIYFDGAGLDRFKLFNKEEKPYKVRSYRVQN